ncbi:MAG TPA: DUF72 domain-containing protein [Candidatus Limnocylindria bacterium]|nr:DUF72 domain-containing protein [Candidatus Limnocylindria bacterium]
MATAHVGTSGWAYTTWKPKFYPAETKTKDLLRHYATKLATVEVNYTFNHLPTARSIAEWQAATPEDFLFALKASQFITHVDQLRHPADTLPRFLDAAAPLGARLGPVLFQTPPWLKRNDDLLAGFVASLPDGQRFALEVRDASWYVPETYEILASRGVALVHAEGERTPSPLESLGATAGFSYVRLRDRNGYPDDAVDRWAARARQLLEGGRDVYAYFRHDDDGANGLSALHLKQALA